MKRIGVIIYDLILGLLAAAFIAIGVLWGVYGIVPRIILSSSMEPNIHMGSVTFIDTNTGLEELQVGDVIAYHATDSVEVAHRIIDISEKGIRTKGDANEGRDKNLVTKENYIGKIIYTIPMAGLALLSIRTPFGILIGIAMVLFTALININSSGKQKRERRKRRWEKGREF